MGDDTLRLRRGARGAFEYQHAFIQHAAGNGGGDAIPLGVAEGLNAWGADGWEVVHMEPVWAWHQQAEQKSWPEQLRGYYVTFKRALSGEVSVATAMAEAELSLAEPAL